MNRILALVASAALLGAGCFKSSSTVTTPSNTSSTLGGTWVTVSHVPGTIRRAVVHELQLGGHVVHGDHGVRHVRRHLLRQHADRRVGQRHD